MHGLLIGLVASFRVFFLPVKADSARWPRYKLILGHRGTRKQGPENTLYAIKKAFALGADGVEFDVLLTKDNHPIVLHDDTLDRTTNQTGEAHQRMLLDFAQINAAAQWPSIGFEPVPELEALLRVIPDGKLANVELKEMPTIAPGDYLKAVLPVLNKERGRLLIVVSSFDPVLLMHLRKQAPDLCLALLLCIKEHNFFKSLRQMAAIKPDALHVSGDLARPWLVSWLRRLGFRIGVWTVNDPKVARTLLQQGVDAVFSDLPVGFIESVRQVSDAV